MDKISAVPTQQQPTESAAPAAAQQDTQQVIVFLLGEEYYGLPIDQIKEVVATPVIARVPMSPDYIRGVANIRGSVLAIVDLEKKFNLPVPKNNADSTPAYTLVVESWEHNMGILVRDVPNTLNINNSQIDHSSQVLQESATADNYVSGVIKHDERLIILIDIFQVISKPTS